jgi:hypothetical protein
VLEEKGYQYNGVMSDATRRKIQKIWTNFYNTCRDENIKMITLTLPVTQKYIGSDKEIKRDALTQLLQWIKSEYVNSIYLWRAETQANGNIHFHILTNAPIVWHLAHEDGSILESDIYRNKVIESYKKKTGVEWEDNVEVREVFITNNIHAKWAALLANRLVKQKMITEGIEDRRNRYISMFKEKPCCNVAYIKKGDNNVKYLTKYLSKDGEGERRKIEGRIWGMCDVLKKFTGIQILGENQDKILQSVMEECSEVIPVERATIIKASEGVLEIRYSVFLYCYMCHAHEFVKCYDNTEAEIQLAVIRLILTSNPYLRKIAENGSYIEKLHEEAKYFFLSLYVDNT